MMLPQDISYEGGGRKYEASSITCTTAIIVIYNAVAIISAAMIVVHRLRLFTFLKNFNKGINKTFNVNNYRKGAQNFKKAQVF